MRYEQISLNCIAADGTGSCSLLASCIGPALQMQAQNTLAEKPVWVEPCYDLVKTCCDTVTSQSTAGLVVPVTWQSAVNRVHQALQLRQGGCAPVE